MREVLYSQTASFPKELYYMYRGVALEADTEIHARAGLRFDVTVLRAGKVGQEYIKTAGHYHPQVAGSGLTYPELYQVLDGRAHYLLQKVGENPAEIVDVVIIEAGPGDRVLVPPGYGHITINPGPGPLVMANWVAAGFASIYQGMRAYRGGAYYEVEEKGRGLFVENGAYSRAPAPRLVRPGLPAQLGLPPGPLYSCPLGRLDFLRDPRPLAAAMTHGYYPG
ncbi:MAG TPA: glucose-6-phosphate isomerase [Clostridiales bacterium UBA8153]|nr:glucose-6-phosphate isomerase [Clostridiales bacterium UBA8153]